MAAIYILMARSPGNGVYRAVEPRVGVYSVERGGHFMGGRARAGRTALYSCISGRTPNINCTQHSGRAGLVLEL